MRLDVRILGTEEFTGAVDGQLLSFVHFITAAVPALAGVTLGILVGQTRTLGGHNGLAGEVFTSDEFDVVLLPLLLGGNDGCDFWVDGGYDIGGVFGLVHFANSGGVASACEGRAEPGIDDLTSVFWAGGFSGEDEHVAVIVLPGDHGSLHVMHKAGLDAGVTVSGDAHADAGGADEHTGICATIEHAGGHEVGEVGIVH